MTFSLKIKDDQVRWGIIGVGDVCEKKSAPAMQKIAHSSIAAVMRRNISKAADYASRHGIDKWYGDALQLIHDPEVNAVYIATPPSSHLEYTLMAAKAGKPVYVEKPMALDYPQCLKMIDTCARYGVPLYVAYYRRSLPGFLKIKSIIQSGSLGDIRLVEIRLFKAMNVEWEKRKENWRVDPRISGGGHFVDLASHQFDFLDFVFGPVTGVKGHAKNQAGLYPAEDIVTANFKLGSDILGYGIWCFTVPDYMEEEKVTIFGSQGKLSFSFFGEAKITLELSGRPIEIIDFVNPEHIQHPLIQDIVEDLLGRGEAPSTGYSAARTNWVIDKILKRNNRSDKQPK